MSVQESHTLLPLALYTDAGYHIPDNCIIFTKNELIICLLNFELFNSLRHNSAMAKNRFSAVDNIDKCEFAPQTWPPIVFGYDNISMRYQP